MAFIAAHLNAGHSGGDSVAIGIYSPSSPPPYSLPPILMVSEDVKHVYLLTLPAQPVELAFVHGGSAGRSVQADATHRTTTTLRRKTAQQ